MYFLLKLWPSHNPRKRGNGHHLILSIGKRETLGACKFREQSGVLSLVSHICTDAAADDDDDNPMTSYCLQVHLPDVRHLSRRFIRHQRDLWRHQDVIPARPRGAVWVVLPYLHARTGGCCTELHHSVFQVREIRIQIYLPFWPDSHERFTLLRVAGV
jgi:hypothetical protein